MTEYPCWHCDKKWKRYTPPPKCWQEHQSKMQGACKECKEWMDIRWWEWRDVHEDTPKSKSLEDIEDWRYIGFAAGKDYFRDSDSA